MKRCPTCNRTYHDEFSFCLDDGALLSAPFDSEKTLVLPTSRHASLPPTEVLQSQSKPKISPKRQRQQKFFCKSKDARAEGELISKGFIVFQGSKCSQHEVPSIGKALTNLRKDLIESGTLKLEGNTYKFTVDYIFSSPSSAAGVVLGREANGWTEWKTKGGITLNEIKRQAATNGEEFQEPVKHILGSSTEGLYLTFWKGFIEHCGSIGTFLSLHKPSTRHYFTIGVGRANFAISVTASSQKKRLGCEIYLSGSNAERNLKLLEKYKQRIEEKTGRLDWQELPNKQDCRIVLYRWDIDIADKSAWGDAYAWLKSQAELFYITFSPLIKALPR
jgi:uncharacterized protein DUF4268/uncharacterized protein DUF4357